MSGLQKVIQRPARTVSTTGVFVASMALVVSASTLVSDFTGFTSLGWGFVISLGIGFLIVLPLALSAADLTVAHAKAGGIYHLTRAVLGTKTGNGVALTLGFVFFGGFLFGSAAETMAGAHALKAMFDSEVSVRWFVLVIALAAVVPNLFGLRNATWVTGLLLAIMLGIRWYFGLAGFLGFSDCGEWSLANIQSSEGVRWFGANGIISCGLAFGFWSFVGIEGACSLAEETKQPRKSIPRGLILAMVAIFLTTVVMGLGAIGSQPIDQWRAVINDASEYGRANPQLVFGDAMFGPLGRLLIALASVASTLSSLLIAFAAVPRMIFAMARDGMFFGRASAVFARLHPKTGVPVPATILVFALYLSMAMMGGVVVDCLQAAAYLWFIRYVIVHLLAVANRVKTNSDPGILGRSCMLIVATAGMVGTLIALWFGFAGSHQLYGSRALIVIGAACFLAAVSIASSGLRFGRVKQDRFFGRFSRLLVQKPLFES